MVIESGEEKCSAQTCALLSHLASVVTTDQITQGFSRILAQMPYILLDVPTAYTHHEDFAVRCTREGFCPPLYSRSCPQGSYLPG